jgi:hypothetical protein
LPGSARHIVAMTGALLNSRNLEHTETTPRVPSPIRAISPPRLPPVSELTGKGGAQHQHVLTLDHFLDRLWSTSFIGRSMKHGGFCTHVRCAPWDPMSSLPGGKKSACRCRPAATQPAIPLCRVSSCRRPTRPGSSVRRMNGPAFIAAPPARGRRPPQATPFSFSHLFTGGTAASVDVWGGV